MNAQRIRQRMSGDRRRSSLANLVRTRTGIVKVPPVPQFGFIQRIMRPELIEDYAGLSTGNWSSGTTGGSSDVNCFYFHYTTPNQRTTSREYILSPVRWRIAAPTVDDGYYEALSPPGSSTFVSFVQFGASLFGMGKMCVAPTLLAPGSHAKFFNRFMTVRRTPAYLGAGTTYPSGLPPAFLQPNFQAIAPTLPVWNAYRSAVGGTDNIGYLSFFAARHWVNGSPVDDVRTDLPQNTSDPKWQVRLSPGDEYFIDVWYRVKSTAFLTNPAEPAKACIYLPRSVVSSSSESVNTQHCQFANVNFSPKFNYSRQTYTVTLNGHSGWTFKDGTNGPHPIATADGWTKTQSTGTAERLELGNIIWAKNVNDDYCRAIVLRHARELVHVEFYPGPLMTGLPGNIGCVWYRIVDDNTTYRKRTASRDYGTIHHASPGLFRQDGTSTFEIIPWMTRLNTSGASPFNEYGGPSGTTLPTGPTYSQLPTSITLRLR